MTMKCYRLGALVLALCLVLAAPPVSAQTFDEALQKFAGDSFSDTEAGIEAVASSGDPQAAAVIQALQDARLFLDPASKKIFIKEASGTFLDAATGKAATAPADLKPVRVNNRLRRAIEAALGGLTLVSSDKNKRYDAAQSVFKSRDAAALPALNTALAKETDSSVRRALA